MTARQLPQSDYLRLKSLYRRLVKLAGGYCAAADLTRVSKTVLHDYGSPDRTAFPPADILADLETEVGQPVVSRELVRLVGETNVQVEPIRDTEIPAEGAKVTVENGRFQARALEALEDGKVDDRELRDLIGVAEDKMRAAIDLHDKLCALEQARRECARIDGRKAG